MEICKQIFEKFDNFAKIVKCFKIIRENGNVQFLENFNNL